MKELQDIKPGDKVIVNYSHNIQYVREVIRLTKTLIIVGKKEDRYKRNTGQLQGKGKWDINYIEPATTEKIEIIKEKIYRRKLSYALETFKYQQLATEDMEKVYKIIKRYTE
jgi:hypothetical protein